ncbi:flagellar protein FliS [[Pantoea] beijingensis]|uniref:Flagellar secretion chaperone FliS n=1 Tax=[Pantoea] beijingensis TaxID=1324864 RepID=A0A443IIR4_9GAMM|nr:flagellar export chaperone FliS [[Pantoea] beijingensis]RWR03900.1 flagellar protein FliS [[Pantoea] beijingensis]
MYSASGTKAYAKVGLESSVMSATPHQLITLLFDGALSALIRARLFLQEDNLAGKGESLSKAINIIENGLKVGLIDSSGDELADNLSALYAYMVQRLLQANLHNDGDAIQEVETLLRNIADAWKDASNTHQLVQEAV